MFHGAQHGFLKGKSCLTNLLEALDDWTAAYDERRPQDVFYLDFQKAFDSVPHLRLIYKLEKYEIRGRVLKWIEAFLSERKQRVCINSSQSGFASVRSGVPQGSVLGPILFLLYINDLPTGVQSTIKIFADDTKIYGDVSNHQQLQILQADLERLCAWSRTWLLSFNEEKCKVMHLGLHNPRERYESRRKRSRGDHHPRFQMGQSISKSSQGRHMEC